MKVAIIDSGINDRIFPGTQIEQYVIYNGVVSQEQAKDYVGHGSAVASIIINSCPTTEIVSICPGIGISGNPDPIIDPQDLSKAIDIAIEKNADIISISMGTTMFGKRYMIDEACKRAAAAGIIVFTAESPDGIPTLPWGCKNVIRVRAVEGRDYHVSIDRVGAYTTLSVHGNLYRIRTKDNQKYFGTGSSYAVPYLISQMINHKCRISYDDVLAIITSLDDKYEMLTKMLEEEVHLIDETLDIVNPRYTFGNIVLIPFNKEMHSIIRYNGCFDYKVVGVVDSVKKGVVNKDAGELIGVTKNDIRIYKSLRDIPEKVNTLIVGHLDEIGKYDINFTLDRILQDNLETTKCNVFSFIPIDDKWETIYNDRGLKIDTPPVIDQVSYDKVMNAVKYHSPISKPVIGVFGTSSAQGKFTLQIGLKKELEKKQCKCFFFSTENHAQLMKAGFVYADGYGNNHVIKLGTESKIDYLRRIMVYIDNMSDCDMILVGGQSRLIPYDINEQTFIRNAVFLEATLPDLSILVINPLLDDPEYILDSINSLKGIYKCRTIALAFSDYTPQVDDNGHLNYIKLTSQDIEKISQRLYEAYGILCGCIVNDQFLSALATRIFAVCGE